jgi:hypothetical protein
MSYPMPAFEPGSGMFNPVEPIIKPIGFDNVIMPIVNFPSGGDIHEHIGINSLGDITWGSTTVRLPGGPSVHLNWKP